VVIVSTALAINSRFVGVAEKSGCTAIRIPGKRCADVELPRSAPKGLQQASPGQRPGFSDSVIQPSPERAQQPSPICSALSGLTGLWMTLTRGVAPGWVVNAPSARGLRTADRSLRSRGAANADPLRPWLSVPEIFRLSIFPEAPSARGKSRT
jgi:hypothetical protein